MNHSFWARVRTFRCSAVRRLAAGLVVVASVVSLSLVSSCAMQMDLGVTPGGQKDIAAARTDRFIAPAMVSGVCFPSKTRRTSSARRSGA